MLSKREIKQRVSYSILHNGLMLSQLFNPQGFPQESLNNFLRKVISCIKILELLNKAGFDFRL